MPSTDTTCQVREILLPRNNRAIRIENDLLYATILPDKGADIYEFASKPHGLDVLWKSPWGLKRPGTGIPSAFLSSVTWIEGYPGGWQVLFPSGGAACQYKGVEQSFHGEASAVSWDVLAMTADGDRAELTLGIRLYRSPFRIERTMAVERGRPELVIRERITNEGGEPIDYTWGHHPAYGAPFISEACRIDTNATTMIADRGYDPPFNPMTTGERSQWPEATRDGARTDLSRVPGQGEPRASMGFLTDFTTDHAWYSIANRELGFGVALVWPRDAFPVAWFWQEMHASPGFPWYKGVYVMAIEPNTSHPGNGVVSVMESTGLHRTLAPGASAEVTFRALFHDAGNGVATIDPDGTVHEREG